MRTLEEILARLAEIRDEMTRDGADLAALEQEVDALNAERATLEAAHQRRSALLQRISSITGEPVLPTTEPAGTDVRSSAMYREAFLNGIRGIELTADQQRAFTSVAASAGAAIPTQTANQILKLMYQRAPILERITLLHVPGNVKFAVENAKGAAAIHAENAALTATTDTLTAVTLGAYEMCKLVQISKTVMQMSIDAFEGWLVGMISEKLADLIASYLVNGTGSSQPQGIEKAATWGATNSVTVGASASLTADNVRALIGLLPGGYDRNACFVMSKKTLYTDFLPLQDNSKTPIVRFEGAGGQAYIYGYPVVLGEEVAFHAAYLGDLSKVVGNLPEDITVTSQFDINTNSYKYLGCAMFDSKVAVPEAFVKLVKGA